MVSYNPQSVSCLKIMNKYRHRKRQPLLCSLALKMSVMTALRNIGRFLVWTLQNTFWIIPLSKYLPHSGTLRKSGMLLDNQIFIPYLYTGFSTNPVDFGLQLLWESCRWGLSVLGDTRIDYLCIYVANDDTKDRLLVWLLACWQA